MELKTLEDIAIKPHPDFSQLLQVLWRDGKSKHVPFYELFVNLPRGNQFQPVILDNIAEQLLIFLDHPLYKPAFSGMIVFGLPVSAMNDEGTIGIR